MKAEIFESKSFPVQSGRLYIKKKTGAKIRRENVNLFEVFIYIQYLNNGPKSQG